MNRIASLRAHLISSVEPLILETNLDKNHQENHFIYGINVIPHPSKRAKGGEDSYYAADNLLAVADGVGGWNEVGIDPAKYSRELCGNVKSFWEHDQNNYVLDPRALIIDAAGKTKSKGSSTLCLVALEKQQPILNAAYIGDSGYMIFSFNEKELDLVYESPEQTKDFNFPYQIGHQGDPPESALSHTHNIKDQDIVLVASDGLLDNVESEEILALLRKSIDHTTKKIRDIKKLCVDLGNLAYTYSLDRNRESPFAKRALQYGYHFRGGKSDDITIAIGQINLNIVKSEL